MCGRFIATAALNVLAELLRHRGAINALSCLKVSSSSFDSA